MQPDPAPSALSRRKLYFAGIIGGCIAAVVVIMGITSRKMADAKLSEWTESQAVPVVAVATPDTHGQRTTFDLPGRLEAFTQALHFVGGGGYLAEWKTRIGTPVQTAD